jgi:RNA polymerase sigma factor (sigma-70 family)
MRVEQGLLEHWPAMVRACERVVSSREEAEDCASEALVAAIQRGGLGDVRNEEAWLVAVAKRRAFDAVRRDVRGRRRTVRLASELPVDVADAAEAVIDQAEARWLAATARELLPAQASQVLMSVADGHSIAAAADRFGMTKRAAESHLRRARAALRAARAATLGVVAWLAGLRRSAPAVPAATVALAVTLLVLPGTGGPDVDAARPGQRPHAGGAAGERTVLLAARTQATAGRPAAPVRRAAPARRQRPPRAPTTVGRVQTRAAGVTVTRKSRPAPSDPVGWYSWCVEHFEVSTTHVGC